MRHLIRTEKANLKISRVRQSDNEATSLLEYSSINVDWLDLHLGGPSQLDVFVDHEVALHAGDETHEAWSGEATVTIGSSVALDLVSTLVWRHVEIGARCLKVVRDEAGWREAVSFLESDAATMLPENEEGLLTQNNDVVLFGVSIGMEAHLPGLLTDIGRPLWIHL